ncbi:MAG: B12-binding domain-containing radical SAM protein [Thermoleophilia bacterium]|nr:B12-binding domain-containing radical SAM protein [Thermoleophilia bacterium]
MAPHSQAHTLIPPLGPGYLAASSRSRGHEVTIFDMAKEGWGAGRGAEAVASYGPDLVGISILSTAYLPARDLVSAIKERLSGAIVVVGGPHVTALPEATLEDLGVDIAMVGESEHTFPQLIDRLDSDGSLESMPSLCYREDGGFRQTRRADFHPDLDSLEFPAWDLMDPRAYPDKPHQLLHKKFPVAPIITTRGCPYDCIFCSSTILWGKRLRTRSPENVLDEIEMLVREYGVREIHFEDDNFTQKRSHVKNVCEEILRRGLKFVWSCPNGVRIDSLDDEILALMRRSGCHSLGLGIESGSQEVLDRNLKRLDLAKVSEQVDMIRSHGIAAHGFFFIGLPGETEETVKQTIRFAREVRFSRANFSLLTPLPGTAIYDEFVAGQPGKLDFRTLNFFTPFPIGELGAEQLKRWQRRAVLGFYLRLGPIAHLISRFRLSQTVKILKALLDYT